MAHTKAQRSPAECTPFTPPRLFLDGSSASPALPPQRPSPLALPRPSKSQSTRPQVPASACDAPALALAPRASSGLQQVQEQLSEAAAAAGAAVAGGEGSSRSFPSCSNRAAPPQPHSLLLASPPVGERRLNRLKARNEHLWGPAGPTLEEKEKEETGSGLSASVAVSASSSDASSSSMGAEDAALVLQSPPSSNGNSPPSERRSPDKMPPLSPFVHGLDDDRVAYQLELLQDLPRILVKAQSRKVSELREAAEELRELAQSTSTVVGQVVDAGALRGLMPLLQHFDPAVVQPAVLAVGHLAQHKVGAERLTDCGIMASLTTVLLKAGDARPRPHTSIQGDVAAAYLTLFSTLRSTRSVALLTSVPLVRNLIQLVDPASKAHSTTLKDALRLLLLLAERADARGTMVSLGMGHVLVELLEDGGWGEKEVLEAVSSLLFALSKNEAGARQLCGCPKPGTEAQAEDQQVGQRASSMPSRGASLLNRMESEEREDATMMQLARIQLGVLEQRNARPGPQPVKSLAKELSLGGRGVRALVGLLRPRHPALVQDHAASALTRLLTRGIPECSQAVRAEASLRPAVEELARSGSGKIQRKASALLEALEISGHQAAQQ